MAFKNSQFRCLDNTGVLIVKCIYVYSNKTSKPGSIILVSLKKVLPHKKIKKGQLYKAVIIRLKKPVIRFYNLVIYYYTNAIVLLKKNELVPLGTRIFGSVYFELRLFGFMKIVTLSTFLI